MTNNELYDVIFKRKSVRKYHMTQLSQDTLEQLQAYTGTLKKLDGNIKVEFTILTSEKVKGMFAIKAPHYICIYSEKKDGYLVNAGFLMQQLDLYLSAGKLGSCWLGMAKPDKEIPLTRNGLEFVIMLAFGSPEEPVHRTDKDQFKRNSLSEITSIENAEELLEPVRLAPSATNSQPWFFSGDSNEIIVSRKKLSMLKAQLLGKMNNIDTGIALCHLWLSADRQGKNVSFDFQNGQAPQGFEFMTKVKVG
ncbi:MAG: nitroreductase [Eubacterium sp.]|nr:nitroreductase [Eubacterium sp.]